MSTHSHRPTLKQTNKKFKSRGSTKRSTKTENKGRVGTKQSSSKTSSSNNQQNKQQRRNTAKQLQSQKKESLLQGKRLFEGRFGAPRIILVLPLTEDVNGLNVVNQLLHSAGEDLSSLEHQGFSLYRCKIQRFNQHFHFIVPAFPTNTATFMSILDSTKIADYILPVLSAPNQVGEWGETTLRCIQAQSCSETFGIIQGLNEVEKKEETGIRHSLHSFLSYFFPNVPKLSCVEQPNELSNTIRSIATGTPKSPSWRDYRSYLLTEKAEWEGTTLKLTGVVRGEHLNSNRLIHIPNSGDYQIDKVC